MENYTQTQLKTGIVSPFILYKKEVRSTQKQPSCSQDVKNGGKSCEIKGGSQEMITNILRFISLTKTCKP